MARKMTIAVDFDGTLAENDFPRIGAPKWNVIEKVRKWHEEGHIIIIWTCRTGQYLLDVIEFLHKNKVPYHYVNENPTCSFGDYCRKIVANVYIDDRALNVNDVDSFDLNTGSIISDFEEQARKDIEFLCCHLGYSALEYMKEIKALKERYGL